MSKTKSKGREVKMGDIAGSNLVRHAASVAAAPLPAPATSLPPCATCRWKVWDGNNHRCHGNPPQIRIPYENMAAWPVVPATGGGCRLWEERK